MRQILSVLGICMIISCVENTTSFEPIDCYPSDSIPNSNLRRIFKPCREYIYTAKYWDSTLNLISNEKIWMMATGKGWEYQPDRQDEIIIQYAYDTNTIDYINQFSINPELQHWEKQTSTGVIETAAETWMHPFRSNQYTFTEVAPFPSVRFPLQEGKKWSSNLNIYEGWGSWENSTLTNTYWINGYDTITTEFAQLGAWHINSITQAEFGSSTHAFWYNEEYGFVKMIIKNYRGQILQFELNHVKDPM
ncbi:MAG: hypothetical protein AAF519_11500 [Bacteroidota bacterium]